MKYIDTVNCPNCNRIIDAQVDKIPTIYQRAICLYCGKPYELNVTIKFDAKRWPFGDSK